MQYSVKHFFYLQLSQNHLAFIKRKGHIFVQNKHCTQDSLGQINYWHPGDSNFYIVPKVEELCLTSNPKQISFKSNLVSQTLYIT